LAIAGLPLPSAPWQDTQSLSYVALPAFASADQAEELAAKINRAPASNIFTGLLPFIIRYLHLVFYFLSAWKAFV
jgi:hypothetical protein